MTDTVDTERSPEPAGLSANGRLTLVRLGVLVALSLVIAIGLSQWRNPVSAAVLVVAATLGPVVGFSVVARRIVPGPGFRVVGLGIVLALAAWTLLGFLSVLAFQTTAPWLQAVLLVVVNGPGLWALAALRMRVEPGPDWRAAAAQAVPPLALVAVAAAAGGIVIHLAQDMARDELTPSSAFAVFWIGMFVLYGVLAVVSLVSRRISATVAIVAIGVVSYVPTFVRSPLRVFNYDEYGHLAEARQIVFSGKLYQPDSTIVIGPKYPGFETLVVPIARLTGLPVVATGQICILLCHVATVLGVASIAMSLRGATQRIALVAALLYAVSPQFVVFDALFSYETLALPLFVAIVALLLLLDRSDEVLAPKAIWGCIVGLFATLLITHHLTTLALVGYLIVSAVVFAVAGLRRSDNRTRYLRLAARDGIFAIVAAGISAAYAKIVDADIFSYLSAFPSSAYRGVIGFLGFGEQVNVDAATSYDERRNATRALFQGTALPGYERGVGIAVQFLLLALCLIVVWQLRRRTTPGFFVFVVLAAAYFVSLPLSFIAVASAGAHRSWAFTFIGIVIVASRAFAPDIRLDPRRGREEGADPAGGAHSAAATQRPRGVLATVLVLLVVMASYATSVNLYSRFPGPYVLGADGRDDTSDVKASAQWLLRNAGPLQPIVATRRNGAVFAAISGSRVVQFPAYTLYFPTTQPDQNTIDNFRATGARYLVADSHLTDSVPQQSYFTSTEPAPPSIPLPAESLRKFDSSTWLQKVYQRGHITIYRVRG